AAIGKAQGLQLDQLDQARAGSAQTARLGQIVTGVALVIAVLASALLAWRITRGITRPIAATVTLAQRIAPGDPSPPPDGPKRHDELGLLQQAMLEMQGQLSELVAGIRSSADSIASASGEIAGGNHNLSQRTEEAASSLQRTATAMHELTRTVS